MEPIRLDLCQYLIFFPTCFFNMRVSSYNTEVQNFKELIDIIVMKNNCYQ